MSGIGFLLFAAPEWHITFGFIESLAGEVWMYLWAHLTCMVGTSISSEEWLALGM